jgi:outer membrane protein assembly factor BamB
MMTLLLLAATAPEPLWQIDLGAPSFGSGAIGDLDGDGRPEVAFGTYFGDARLRVVRGATGEVLFERPSAGGPMDASVAIWNGLVIVADSAYGLMWAYGQDGAERWRVSLPSGTDSPAAIVDVTGDAEPEILVGTMWRSRAEAGCVLCIDPRTRGIVWTRTLSGCIQTGPVVFDLDGNGTEEVLVGAWQGNGRLTCLDGRSGAVLWEFDVGGNQYHGPAVGEFGGATAIVTCEMGGRVVCLRADGTLRWERRLEGDSLFAPITLFDADGEGDLEIAVMGRTAYVLQSDGGEIWRRTLDGESCLRGATPVDLDGDGHEDLLFGAGRHLWALRGRDGAVLWRFDATIRREGAVPRIGNEEIDSAVLLDDLNGDGTLDAFFVCGMGTSENEGRDNYGRAYAVRLPGVRGPAWRYFRGSLRHTGNTRHRQ